MRMVASAEVVDRSDRHAAFRSDARAETLVFTTAAPPHAAVGLKIRNEAALDRAVTALRETGAEVAAGSATLERLKHPVRRGTATECTERRVRNFLAFRAPSGNAIEVAWRPEQGTARYRGARDAGISGFSHVGLCTTDPRRAERLWTEICNARVSDRIGGAPLLRIGAIHHAIALCPTNRLGFQHVNHQVETGDDIMRSYYLLRQRGVPVVFGPGQHPSSSARFLYSEGPDGMVFEYSCGVRSIAEELLYRERQFPFAHHGFCQWGAASKVKEFQ